MPFPCSELLRRRLPCDESAPSLARKALGPIDAIDPVRDDAVLITSELVSNAVMHSGCDPTEDLEVLAELIPGGVRITVTDVGRSSGTPAARHEPVGPGGLGLQLVEKIAQAWGTERRGARRVWADLPFAA